MKFKLYPPKGFFLIEKSEQKNQNRLVEFELKMNEQSSGKIILCEEMDKIGQTAYFINRGLSTILTEADGTKKEILSVHESDIYLFVGEE